MAPLLDMQEEAMIVVKTSMEQIEVNHDKVETKTDECPVRSEAN
jgi:hypothetical protein